MDLLDKIYAVISVSGGFMDSFLAVKPGDMA